MVSNEEIKKMLENRRRGIKPEAKKEQPTPRRPATSRRPVKTRTLSCGSCGAENPPDSKFCINCGAKMQDQDVADEKKPAETKDALPLSGMEGTDYQTCPNCKHQNKPQAKFCVVCGHKLGPVEEGKSTASLLDRVPDEEAAKEKPSEAKFPSVTELMDEEADQEKTPKRSLSPKQAPTLDTSTGPVETEPYPAAEEEQVSVEETSQDEGAGPELQGASSPDKMVLEEEAAAEAPMEEPDLPRDKIPEGVAEDAALTGEIQVDPVDKIKKAKELLDIGAISQEEFEEIKKKYLSLI
jgi:ribosomal protein L40E